jgi:hypothetical protein
VHETLTYYGFPDIHLERIHGRESAQNRLVVAFPDGQPCLKLAAADYATRWNNMVG